LSGSINVIKIFSSLIAMGFPKESTLHEMEELRREAKKFTSEALVKLDLLQSKIQEKREDVKKETAAKSGKKLLL